MLSLFFNLTVLFVGIEPQQLWETLCSSTLNQDPCLLSDAEVLCTKNMVVLVATIVRVEHITGTFQSLNKKLPSLWLGIWTPESKLATKMIQDSYQRK